MRGSGRRGDLSLKVLGAQLSEGFVALLQPIEAHAAQHGGRFVTDGVFPWVLERIRQFTLNDRQTQDLWSRVTGSAIQEQDFWRAYKSHLDLRNRILHRGEVATAEDATESLATAKALIDYVEQASGAAPPPSA